MYVTLDMVMKDARKSGAKPGEYQSRCPACGEYSFYFNTYSQKYICFRSSCNLRGKFNGTEEGIYTDSSLSELKSKLNSLYIPDKEIKEIDLDLFSDPFDKKKYPFAYQYIKSRKFTDKDIERYQLRVGKSYYSEKEEKTINKWKGRIIFPFYDSNVPLYAIGRSYNDSKPKYLNTDGEKSVIVYNLDNIKNKTCIVCEGLISSIFAEKYSGISGVCILGCSISDSQLFQIRSESQKIYVNLDGGVDSTSICKRFFMSGADVYRVDLPIITDNDGKQKGLDPAEMNPDDYKKCIENAVRYKLI